eukprot:10240.XXX_457724_460464_1 [CDS] Oithona nana genome sequencing.
MSKRGAISDLNHDNWDEEEEAQEAGTFAQADKSTLQDRVIKKAKRRGITKTDGPSIFAGFGGFKTSVTDSTSGDKPNFDFLKSSNGSTKEFSFGSPPSMAQNSSLVFGSGATSESKKTDNATFSFGSTSSIEPKAAKVSFGNGGQSTTTTKPSGMFSFGSSNLSTSSSATFSFGAKKEDDTAAEALKSSDDLIKPKESTNEADNPLALPKSTVAVSEAPLITNPLPLPKTSKWSCPICMVQNDNDKESCVCCSEPKPGCKAKKSDEVKDLGGSITSSGFKFGSATASTTSDNGGFKFGVSSTGSNSTQAASTGFQFGSDKPEVATTMPSNKKKEYSQEYLSHLKALNVQVCQWIKTHIEKNPYVFLTPVFKDYEKHLKDLEEKSYSGKEEAQELSNSNSDSSSNKPLLGGLFGNVASSEKAAEPVKFGSGSVGFASSSAAPSFTFGNTNPEGGSKGFSFGKSADEKTSPDKPSGFSFGSKTEETKLSTGFTFGTAASDGMKSNSTATTGFTLASSSAPQTEQKSGFSFGGSSNAGFTFGSSSAANPTGFSFGSGTTTTDNKTTGDNDEEESDEPPKVEVKEVTEDDAYHSVRCKLFYKKDKEFKEKGLGMLHLKKVDKKTQMVVRAETNLGNILLNILVGDSLNITKRKNNLQFGCIPHPPIPGMPEGPAIMLLKVKDSLMADELEEKLNEAIKAS